MFNFFKKRSIVSDVSAQQMQVTLAQEQAKAANQALNDLKAKFEASTKELEQSKSAIAKTTIEVETKLEAAQEEVKAANLALTDLKIKLDSTTKELEQSKTALAKTKIDGEMAVKASQEQAKATTKALTDLQAKLEASLKELEQNKTLLLDVKKESQEEINRAKQENQLINKSLDETKARLDTLNTELVKLKADYLKKITELKEKKAKELDLTTNNELLSIQLVQVKEECLENYEQKNHFEKLFHAYKARWERLEARYPNYVDFGAIELLAFDHTSKVPSLVWKVKDYAHANLALPEFTFRIIIQDGYPGISLIKNGDIKSIADQEIIPKLVSIQSLQLTNLISTSTTEYQQLSAALGILGQLSTQNWRGISIPQGLDMSFWNSGILNLIAQWKKLPAVLHFDRVNLKRELIHSDYEHLWLELHNLNYLGQNWRKLEIRIGAALIQPDGFSHYPKFEFPLIDGKHKPFASWFAESHDDAGPKFELRFSLEKKVYDISTLQRLTTTDQALVMQLVRALPFALRKLENQGVTVQRPWQTWHEFARSAFDILVFNQGLSSGSTEKIDGNNQDLPVKDHPKNMNQNSNSTNNIKKLSINSNAQVITITAKSISKDKTATEVYKGRKKIKDRNLSKNLVSKSIRKIS